MSSRLSLVPCLGEGLSQGFVFCRESGLPYGVALSQEWAPNLWNRAIPAARGAATVVLNNESASASSPAPVEMLNLKLRRPAVGDDIDLNATFDVDTPPARPSSIHHGHVKKLCLEKAQ